MSSVISASRRWEGRTSLSEPGCDEKSAWGEEGLASARTLRGDIEESIVIGSVCGDEDSGALGHNEVALDISKTIKGRTCFPSDCV